MMTTLLMTSQVRRYRHFSHKQFSNLSLRSTISFLKTTIGKRRSDLQIFITLLFAFPDLSCGRPSKGI